MLQTVDSGGKAFALIFVNVEKQCKYFCTNFFKAKLVSFINQKHNYSGVKVKARRFE